LEAGIIYKSMMKTFETRKCSFAQSSLSKGNKAVGEANFSTQQA
jgi:hypothetical protein